MLEFRAIDALPWFTFGMQFITGLTTSIVAVLVYRISRRQAETNSEKLRLDLYDRRFRIYTRTLAFIDSILDLDNDSHAEVWRTFREACDEAQFLFPTESGIHAHLLKLRQDGEEMETAHMLMAAADYTGTSEEKNEGVNRHNLLFEQIQASIPPLVGLLTPYMKFPPPHPGGS